MLANPVILVNSSKLGGAYMRQSIMAPLVDIMACGLFGAKQLSEPVVVYFSALWINIQQFYAKKYLVLKFAQWDHIELINRLTDQLCYKEYIVTMSYFSDKAIKLIAIYSYIWFPRRVTGIGFGCMDDLLTEVVMIARLWLALL